MTSITAQQIKLNLELVPKEKRLKIGKFNGRLNPGKIQREPIFQVDSVYKHENFYRFKLDKRKKFKLTLEIFRDIFKICPRVQGQDFDALPTDEEIMSFLRDLGHTGEINSLNDVTLGLNKLRLSRAQILWGMYHQKNVDYVERLWEDFIYQIENKAYKKQEKIPEMKEIKAYKTYFGFATGATPPKKARKFKKPVSPKLTIVPVSNKEPTGKSKRVKRPAKKSTKAPARGVVIRETPKIPFSKKKEKGNDEDNSNNEQDSSDEDSYQENDNDNYKTQAENDNESNSEHKTDENESGSESDQEENEDVEEEVKDELVKTQSNDSNDEDETKITDKR
ncbi:hypothetical protein Tco_0237199 [Tanacetum coccineum]